MIGKIRLTYLRLLIVAVTLGVVARIVTPQLTEASTEEKLSALIDELQQMRAQLDLYRVQHGEQLPPTDSFASFEAVMTTKAGQYGPYISRIPTNPFNGLSTVRFDGEPAGSGNAGWRLDTETGLFQADNDAAYAAL